MNFLTRMLVCVVVTGTIAGAADVFLRKNDDHDESLLRALQAVFGPDSLETRLGQLEERLRPTFLSLPKQSGNVLSHAAARYALQRINVDLHGWSIAGLEPNASSNDATSVVASGILRGLAPPHIEHVFEEHLNPAGFSLRDLAILASTIEQLVHDDQKLIMLRICELFDIPTTGPIDTNLLTLLIHAYQAMFLVGANKGDHHFDFSKQHVESTLAKMPRAYPGWADTVMFLDDERETVAFNEFSRTNPFRSRENSLQLALRVVEQSADDFANEIAEPECQEMKEDLLSFEIGETGRIRLADFYRAGIDARFFYVETKEYLQAIGAVDDSDGIWGPKVIVSNYVLAKSNCLSHNRHTYSICCQNECESLYGRIEQQIGAADSTPERLAQLVAGFSTSTVQGPRNLSSALMQRLDEIALSNAGKIMLHSRLLAQWMHQAFPRECPYPHLTGSTTSLSHTAWGKLTGLAYRVDKDQKGKATRKATLSAHADRLDSEFDRWQNSSEEISETDTEDLMWTSEDELYVEPPPSVQMRLWQSAGTFLWRTGIVACVLLTAKIGYATSTWNAFDRDKKKRTDCTYV